MDLNLKVICIQEPALFELIDTVVGYVKKEHGIKEDRWITGEEAMKLLRITSRTTLQKLRDTYQIVFTTGTPTLLYDRDSINAYLERNAQKPL